MAGLVPAIHALLRSQDVDARHKAGHDVATVVLPNADEAFTIGCHDPDPRGSGDRR